MMYRSSPSRSWLLGLALLGVTAAVPLIACSDSNDATTDKKSTKDEPTGDDDGDDAADDDDDSSGSCPSDGCAEGNECIEFKGKEACRRLCTSHTGTEGCPFNYFCFQPPTGKAFCEKNTYTYDKKDKGQWGAACNAAGGLENPDCDTEQGFWCLGLNPSDADAYCTVYDCNADADCGAGFWCATINQFPSVETTMRGAAGEIRTVCKKREFCEPCTTDFDCGSKAGVVSHCIDGGSGLKTCANECTADTNCNNEATCTAVDGVDATVCVPRSGACVGDGSLCAPCRSDQDCPSGVCAKTQYSTERFCTVASASNCKSNDCPAMPSIPGSPGGACLTKAIGEVPVGSCVGLFKLGDSNYPGCYTPRR